VEAKLGKVYKDSITGFTGMAMGRTVYLHGCISVALLSLKLPKDGKPNDWVWFDEPRLISRSKATAGGPQPLAPSH
jgi:hypothetical protein